MNVLVFLGNDAANLSIESVVRELIKKHNVKLVAQDSLPQNIQMFSDLYEYIISKADFTDEMVEWADCIFCTVMSATRLRDYKKYVFSFCHMNPQLDQPRGYDFVFTLGSLGESNVPKYFASMPVGLAKNDTPPSAISKKQILYIDAGHFPFGQRGQRQIAEMLLEICEKNPEHNICVKPRWFPNATDLEMSNPNFGHIYNELDMLCPNGLPENLELLYEYRNLQELIDESECVISSCTSAYLDVAMRGKPLLLIKGIENDDMYHLRNAYFEHLYEFAQDSGCVVDYKEVTNYLPAGKICNPKHLEKAFAYPNGATNRIVEVMEYIYENFISKGLYPDIKEYMYESYKETITTNTHIQMDDLLAKRRFCATETAVVLTYKISDSIDWTEYYQQQMMLCQLSVSTKKLLKSYKNLREELVELKTLFLLKNKQFIQNDVDESFLYYAMYTHGKYAEMLAMYEEQNLPHSSLIYYVGKIYWALGQTGIATECLKQYLKESVSRQYSKYITDVFDNKIDAFKKVITYLSSNAGDVDELAKYIRLFNDFAKKHPRDKYFSSNTFLKKSIKKLYIGGYPAEANAVEVLFKIQNEKTKSRNLYLNKVKSIYKKYKKICKVILKKIKKYTNKVLVKIIKKINAHIRKTRLWKWLGLVYNDIKRKKEIYNDQEKDVMEFKNLYDAEKCFVIGNGPSLLVDDLEKIKASGYTCFASNKIYKLYNQTNWRPDYYACFDDSVFEQNLHDILSKIDCDKFVNRNFAKNIKNYEKVMKTKLSRIHYSRYRGNRKDFSFYPQAANIDSGGSVTFVLLELAWMMGFREIYLIGCDHSYDAFQNLDENTKTIISTETTSNDYFSKDYMRPGEVMRVGDLDKATRGYMVARKYIESHGGKIYNATRGGKLEVFERVDLDELLADTQ